MGLRVDLQTILSDIVSHTYFQPPESLQLVYPCIVYSLQSGTTLFADDIPYEHRKRYTVTLITKDPDSNLYAPIISLPTCVFNRYFSTNNLNHYVFNLYF